MNQNPISSGSQMPPQPVRPELQKTPVGPIIGAAIVIFLLVAGGLYYYGARLSEDAQDNTVPYIPNGDVMQIEDDDVTIEGDANIGLPQQSTSDEAAAIEADFDVIDLETIDASNETELNSI